MISPVLMILICLVLAFILSEFFKLFKLPKVIGQISAGLILGMSSINLLIFTPENVKVLSFLANLGIILLFYYIGLELDFSIFAKRFKKSFTISIFKAFLPLLMGFFIMRYVFNLNFLTSVIIGVSLSAGALSVSMSIIEELKLLKTKIANYLLSVGIITDIIEILIVGIVLAMFQFNLAQITLPRFFFNLLMFILFIFFARLAFVPFTIRFFDRESSSTSRFMAAIIIVFFIVSLSEALGLGALIGALIAGMVIRSSIFRDKKIPNWEEHDIARSIHIISFGFLIPLFFVWIGLNTNFGTLITHYRFIFLLVVIALVGVIGGTILAVKLTKGKFKDGVILGFGLSPKGDIGFVLASLALEVKIISDVIFSSLILMGLIITVITPVVFKALIKKYDGKRM